MIRMNCDYLEGCHPAILEALTRTNLEQTPGYGLDPHCENAARAVREFFECPDAAVHFLVGGTQANTTVISAALRPWEGVLSADTGHINTHETGAIEGTGHKVIPLPNHEGRITAPQVSVVCALQGEDEHVVKPGMVYISFPTEVGTLYNLAQLKDLYFTCRQEGLYLFIDGARLGYGLTSPINDVTPADIARYCDVFTMGGTKVGALFGEAVVITNPQLAANFRYMMKQRGGLLAKGRLLGIQFETLLAEDRYLSISRKAVDNPQLAANFRYMMKQRGGLLAKGRLLGIQFETLLAEDRYLSISRKAVEQAMRIRQALLNKGIELYVDSPTNQLFPIFTDNQIAALEDDFELASWERLDESRAAFRICTSWATSDAAVDQFIAAVERL